MLPAALLLLVLAPVDDLPADPLPADPLPADNGAAAAAVLGRWERVTRGVTSVRATYRGFAYDHAFRTVALTAGEFHHGAGVGTLVTLRPTPAGGNRLYECRGIAHRPGSPPEARRWFWDAAGGLALSVNDARREATRLPGAVRLLGYDVPFDAADLFPFAPGRPFGHDPAAWRLRVASRTANAVFVRAESTTAETAARFDSILLMFRRSDWSLRGVRIVAPGERTVQDYLFDGIHRNPGPPPRPALEGYRMIESPAPPAAAPARPPGELTAEYGRLWRAILRRLLDLP